MVWTINGTEADGMLDTQPSSTPGESGDYPFRFRPTEGADDHITRFETVRDYDESAGQFDTYEAIDGTVHWREQQTTGPSPLVKIEPPTGNQVAHSIWGLVESVEDATMYGPTGCELTLSIMHIAAVGTGTGEFDTESAIRTELEVTGP